ncbi:MAG: hypothetical protein AB8B64_17655 [Granulosicoccus sp.]
MSGSSDTTKGQRFWRALVSEKPASQKPVDLTHDLSDLDADEREARRIALTNMLTANQARQRSALRSRRPSMAIGQRVAIISGQLAGREGVVLDADFIHSRVQIELDNLPEPQWVSFKRVGGCV